VTFKYFEELSTFIKSSFNTFSNQFHILIHRGRNILRPLRLFTTKIKTPGFLNFLVSVRIAEEAHDLSENDEI